MNERASQSRKIFCEIMDLQTEDEQDRFLEAQCTDHPEIEPRIRALLAAHRSSDKFLRGSVESTNAIDALGSSGELIDTQIGHYRLVEEIGEGGFGVVYRAEQQEPIRRQVALKLIKPGMDTRQVVARFEHERQALAMMDHLNIARVLDGGATDNGRPFFVMELVLGRPITGYCDEESLGLIDRLKLFQSICDGVQHAHQKGVIHRDLKPSNILVVTTPAGPVAKIIDFGVAKVIHEVPGERSSLTHGGTLIGTPVYMSAEQFAPGQKDIDTRTDIHSLGVVLYELLAGTTPFEKKWFETLSLEQLRRTICEVDPPRPSQRVMQLAASKQNGDSSTQREAKKKASILRNELDWIVMKALEKERERRYSTAGALASDITRYLQNEAVRAGPPSATYRFRKFARRNRVALTAITLMLFGLSGMVVFSGFAVQHARDAESRAKTLLSAEKRARSDAEIAKNEAFNQRLEADRQRTRAEANLADARAAIDQIIKPVLNQTDAANPVSSDVKNELLREALRFYELFLERNSTDPELRAETARASFRVSLVHSSLGEFGPAEQAARRALQLFESLTDRLETRSGITVELAASKAHLARILRERNAHLAEAESLSIAVIDIYDQRLVDHPDDEATMIDLAEGLHELGYLRAFFGNPGMAEAPLNRCVDIEQQLVKRKPNNMPRVVLLAHRMNSLGIFLRHTRRASEAETLHRRALGLFDDLALRIPGSDNAEPLFSERTRSLSHLAFALELQLALKESEEVIRQSIEFRRATMNGDGNGERTERVELALSLVQLAGVLEKQSRLELASVEYQAAIELLKSLQKAFPQIVNYQFHYLNTMRRWGNLAIRQSQPELARQRFELLADCPSNSTQAKTIMAGHLSNCPLVDMQDANRAVELARAATVEMPFDGKSWAALGAALFRKGSPAEAISILEKATKLLQPAGDNSAAYFLAMALWNTGQTEKALDHWQGINPSWDSQRPEMLDLQVSRKEAATLLGIEQETP